MSHPPPHYHISVISYHISASECECRPARHCALLTPRPSVSWSPCNASSACSPTPAHDLARDSATPSAPPLSAHCPSPFSLCPLLTVLSSPFLSSVSGPLRTLVHVYVYVYLRLGLGLGCLPIHTVSGIECRPRQVKPPRGSRSEAPPHRGRSSTSFSFSLRVQ